MHPEANMDNTPNTQILVEQFKAGLELYKHEDRLNWQKINLLIYSNSLLFAAIALAKDNIYSKENIAPFFVLATIGLAISICFGISIKYGVHYLKHRKEKLAKLEEYFERETQVKIFEKTDKNIDLSPSMKVLTTVPMIFCALWGALLGGLPGAYFWSLPGGIACALISAAFITLIMHILSTIK